MLVVVRSETSGSKARSLLEVRPVGFMPVGVRPVGFKPVGVRPLVVRIVEVTPVGVKQ